LLKTHAKRCGYLAAEAVIEKLSFYRSGEPLRHPKAKAFRGG
jgi:hypothetical protein